MKLIREDILSRTHENMKEIVSAGQGKEYSVHYVKNAFWEFLNLNIYEACIPDRLKLLSKVGQLKVMTASSDYSHIIKIAIFALDEIFSEENEITCKELCELYTKFNKMYTMSRQESYTENELNIFEEAIIDWCIEFKRIFFPLSTTDCSFLKLHSWRYHAVPAIVKYSALNGLSMETYETLHKLYIKIQYQATNKKHVKHKELTPTTSGMKVIYRKTKRFGKILWELNLDSIDEKIKSLKKSENPSHPNYIEGLAQIITALDTFLDISSQDSENDFFIKIYDSVHLESREILRLVGEF
ncbi:uncharacterized protein OCT59_000580 [Rhizophagus irregularis]|uniref:Uncharacterized protein n=2 Tax=Rhizophagus irregularis TaxID=588596 RepID=A0A2P4P2V4_RHIID|nr:hypothetical protein GLOIN_2v1788781 [Rhizophagus irregularis DAOM 181602=DAOM 197198]POG59720.1 hypothetical protein GLOIN_2v1788781 [Rhizophagus irregularis DAOM 181602=DAOM 197198]UZN99302.1 hypothetical protein OCT59_000580 [Rhizophagus irregularis]|eukprot:XP_025166586.1 hypothetical protein GLOIN_2v1788781 [Rhizophagus irregularis DAOM 181602=DAOM 197198]